jgi:hypothetical protein
MAVHWTAEAPGVRLLVPEADLLMGMNHEGQEWNWKDQALQDILPPSLKELEIHTTATPRDFTLMLSALSRFKSEALASFTVHLLHAEDVEYWNPLRDWLASHNYESYTLQFGAWREFLCTVFHCWQTPDMWKCFDHFSSETQRVLRRQR